MIRDVRGRTFEFPQPPQRVVSLVPSITETLFDLGVGESVVGITNFCIFPSDVSLPRVGGTKNPRIEAIRTLRPDLVHMNLEENLRSHAESIEEFAPVFVSEPKDVDGTLDLLTTLGELHGCAAHAASYRTAISHQRRLLGHSAFRFACAIWKDPWMWCGGDTYVSALVSETGGRNVLQGITRYPQLPLEEVLELNPDVIFLPDEPYAFTTEDAAAVVGPRVVGPFPGHFFTWHGTRTLEGLKFLAEVIDR
ncbi:MAG: helical backbone metal receptor [Thermoanaerobaculia bacterium]